MSQKPRISSENQMAIICTELTSLGLNLSELFENVKSPIKIQTVGLVRQGDARAYSPSPA